MENLQKDFFISYNSADLAWGVWIAEQLEDAGYTTIIQAWDFRPGENFMLGMQEAASKSKQTIAVYSDDYFRAAFTQPEWAAALVQDPTGKERKLIPVRVRPCQPIGLLAPIIYIDLVNQEVDAAKQLLLDGVTPGRARRRGPAAFPGKPSSNGKASTSSGSTGSSLSPKPAIFPKNIPPINKTLNVFIVHSPEDKDYLVEIEKQLTTLNHKGLIKTWNSSQILAGSEIEREFEEHWKQAQIILLLVSADLMNDSYDIIQRAIARHENSSACVIPILLRPCLSGLEEQFDVLPLNGKSITSWSNRHEAYYNVATGIAEAAKQLLYTQ